MRPQFARVEPYQRLAKEIHAELIRQELAPSDLTETLGHSRSTTARRLNGEVPFTASELIAVTSLLDVPFHELVSRSDNQRGTESAS